MTELYLVEFNCGKCGQTVKGSILKMLGLFAEHFPEHLVDKIPHLLSLCLDNLGRQFKSNKKPDMQVIAGGILALRSLLIHFNGDFAAGKKKSTPLVSSSSSSSPSLHLPLFVLLSQHTLFFLSSYFLSFLSHSLQLHSSRQSSSVIQVSQTCS
jgi:hypothetical protein